MASHAFGTRQTRPADAAASGVLPDRLMVQKRNRADSKALSCPRDPGFANSTSQRL